MKAASGFSIALVMMLALAPIATVAQTTDFGYDCQEEGKPADTGTPNDLYIGLVEGSTDESDGVCVEDGGDANPDNVLAAVAEAEAIVLATVAEGEEVTEATIAEAEAAVHAELCGNHPDAANPAGQYPDCIDTPPEDLEAPSAVPNARISYVGINAFRLSWDDASDNVDVGHYNVYYSTKRFTDTADATVIEQDRNFNDFTDVSKESVHYVAVAAVDTQDNVGPLSTVFKVKTLHPGITIDKAPPRGTPATHHLEVEEHGHHAEQVHFDVSEDAGSFAYYLNTNDFPQNLKKVAIDTFLIDNNEFIIEQPAIDIERVEIGEGIHEDGGIKITVTLKDDDIGLGDRTYILRHVVDSSKVGRDLRYDNAPVKDLVLHVLEDEVEPSIHLANEAGLTADEGGEGGDQNATFQVKLSRQPSDDVFVHVQSTDESRLRLGSQHYVRFGTQDWDQYQTVTVTTVNNGVVDGDVPVIVTVTIDEEESALEFINRAPDRRVVVTVFDDELDADKDGILDSEDGDPTDPFNKEFRPRNFKHQLSSDGNQIRFSWTAVRDDRISHYVLWDISDDPTNVAEVNANATQREYTLDYKFPGGVHKYALQPILHSDLGAYSGPESGAATSDGMTQGEQSVQSEGVSHGYQSAKLEASHGGSSTDSSSGADHMHEGDPDQEVYDADRAVPLGKIVFSQQHFNEVCEVDANGNVTAPDADADGVCDAFEDEVGTDKNNADTDGDGRDDYMELFNDGTDPADLDSRYTLVPTWGRNPWVVVGSVLILASLVVVIVSIVLRAGRPEQDAVAS